MSRFGDFLIEERKKAGVSQAQLAAKIGLSDTYISAIETGRKAAPPHVHVVALAACFGLDERDLWRLAMEDREERLRERLDGVPTSIKLGSGFSREGVPPMIAPSGDLGSPDRVIEKIEQLLPSEEERKTFVRSLEVLAEILREMT